MFRVEVNVVYDAGAMNTMLRSETGLVGKDMLRRAKAVQRAAKATAPIGKVGGGKMRQSIMARVVKAGRGVEGEVNVNVPYALWVTKGTGIYAGRGLIRPRSAQYMVFSVAYGRYNIPQAGGYYYAEYVKGQKPNPFLLKALPVALK